MINPWRLVLLQSLGYEQYDGPLCRLARSPLSVLTWPNSRRTSAVIVGVSPISTPSAASRAQIPAADLRVFRLSDELPRR